MPPRSARPHIAARRPGGTDVARLAGVSQKTVSRVFNDEPAVTEQTRRRVLAAAAQLGYRPNGAARALLTGRTCRIGVVSLGTAHFGPSSLLVALERAALATQLFAEHRATPSRTTRWPEIAAADRLLAQGVDAIILSEPIDDGGEPLEVEVPVLTLGIAPRVSAPTVLSVPAVGRRRRGGRGDEVPARARPPDRASHRGAATVVGGAGPARELGARARCRGRPGAGTNGG